MAGGTIRNVIPVIQNGLPDLLSLRKFSDRHGLSVLRRVKRRWPIKHSDKLAWLYNVLAMEHPADESEYGSSFYTGFRVVCDDLSCVTGHTS